MIHRFWHGPPHPMEGWTAMAIQSTQGDIARRWTLANLPSGLPCGPLDPADDPRHLSNLARYALLWTYGGLWLDHDVIPLTQLPRGPAPYTASLGGRYVGCVMWFPRPGHPLLEALCEAGRTRSGTAPERSGGHLLTELAPAHPDVDARTDLLPFDRDGRRVPGPTPKAVHLWERSYAAARARGLNTPRRGPKHRP